MTKEAHIDMSLLAEDRLRRRGTQLSVLVEMERCLEKQGEVLVGQSSAAGQRALGWGGHRV